MQNILTINPGSTSVKYVLFNNKRAVLDKRTFDRKEDSSVTEHELEWIGGLSGVDRVGIRVVHGGDLRGPLVLDSDIEYEISKFTKFAPIHNSIALDVVRNIRSVLPTATIVVSFDTDFHKSMPAKASTYPINADVAAKYNIKRYGFHGLAVQSALAELKEVSGSLPNKVICAHIGGGCSVTAVIAGKSVDTTMGLTPLEGLMMITRSGSIGPSVVKHIAQASGLSVDRVVDMLNNESGLYGMTGSKNTLDIITRASKRQEPEKLAVDMFIERIVKQIFAYYGTMQGCDALILSGGIGYGNAYLRGRILDKTKLIGLTESNTYAVEVDEAAIIFENTLKV